ncbi:MAG TPA: cell division protein FtsK [Desulfobacteraceae bacterium]|nr:cell division protein FtsK [Desulfobacteraceae bacterium]
MRKELFGIILFFLLVFILCSLLSYSPHDPSLNHAVAGIKSRNLFGLLGSYVSDILIGLFGFGAFWLPVLILFPGINFLSGKPGRNFFLIFPGALFLTIATGALFSLKQSTYIFLGEEFSSGGITGISLKLFLVKYSNLPGAVFILTLLVLVGISLSTGFSFKIFAKRFLKGSVFFTGKVSVGFVFFRGKFRKKNIEQGKAVRKQKSKKIKIKDSKKGTPLENEPVGVRLREEQPGADSGNDESGFALPTLDLLDDFENKPDSIGEEYLLKQSGLLEKKLADFDVNGRVVAVFPGPVITTFEYAPPPGVKINKIVNLSDDLALALKAISIRIVAPIPGKAAVGIEIPNDSREIVRMKEILASNAFKKRDADLALCMGKDIVGTSVVVDLAKMPHLLIAGATGTGKSVGLNAMICSVLYFSNPDKVKFIMVDPKRIELSIYNGIPHLITPVVTDVKEATNALFWAVKEMERRYELLAENKCRNLKQYNRKIKKEKKTSTQDIYEELPYIIIVIDELADLMMVASRDVETALTRLAQMARASGIHLILATQRPSVDVLTGIIKANFPTRLTFQVASRIDSRTIIDSNGAENLLGNGDMLLLPPGTAKLQRIHGAYISEAEIMRITEFLKDQGRPEYNEVVVAALPDEKGNNDDQEYDERYDDAVALVTKIGQASISMVQRHLRIGYNRAARIIEVMEQEGVVGPSDGAKPRKILARQYDNKYDDKEE